MNANEAASIEETAPAIDTPANGREAKEAPTRARKTPEGIWTAKYRPEFFPSFLRGNPLIEALPPPPEQGQQYIQLAALPEIDFSALRCAQSSLRRMTIPQLDELYLPPPVAEELCTWVDDHMYSSYMLRTPFSPSAAQYLYSQRELVKEVDDATLSSMTFLAGASGMGKTRLIRRVLGRYPRAIRHKLYGRRSFHETQVVWISVQAPINGAEKGLMLRLFEELDKAAGLTGAAAYAPRMGRKSVDHMIYDFANAACSHWLGILHIDDLQRISEAPKARQRALQWIMQLANAVKCPVIFSGTKAAGDAFSAEFEAARRLSSAGLLTLERPKRWDDAFHVGLAKLLARYQWTDQPFAVTDEFLRKTYGYHCGVTSAQLLMHKNTQRRALNSNSPQATYQHYLDVYRKDFRLMYKGLKALRRNSSFAEEEYEQHADDDRQAEDAFKKATGG